MTEIKCLQNDDWGKMYGKRRPKSNDCGAITVKVTAKRWPKPNDCKAGTYRGLYTAHCSRTMGLLSFEPSDGFAKVNQVDCLRNRKYLRTRLGHSSEAFGEGSGYRRKGSELWYWEMMSWGKKARHLSRYYTEGGRELIFVIGWVNSHMWEKKCPLCRAHAQGRTHAQ